MSEGTLDEAEAEAIPIAAAITDVEQLLVGIDLIDPPTPPPPPVLLLDCIGFICLIEPG